MTSLPRNWEMVRLRDLGRWTGGGTPSKSHSAYWVDIGIPWVSPKDMKRALIEDAEDHISESALAHSSTNLVPEGSILVVTRSGILSHTLPVAKVLRAVAINQDLKALIPRDNVDSDYILYILKSNQDTILNECGKAGTTVANLDTDRLLNFRVPLPPFTEQRQLAAKLDSLFKRSRSAREELARIPQLVERLNKAALQSAFSGRLTNDDSSTWASMTLGDLIVGIDAGKNVRCEERPPKPSERGIVKVSSVTWGSFDSVAAKTPDKKVVLDRRTLIRPGDFLLSRANTQQLVGACVIVGTLRDTNLYLSDKVLRVRFNQPVDAWVLNYLRSPSGRAQIENLSTGNQLSMRNISQAAIRAIRLPVPPEHVRTRILARLDRIFRSISVTIVDTKNYCSSRPP